jgi:hypothetical protein
MRSFNCCMCGEVVTRDDVFRAQCGTTEVSARGGHVVFSESGTDYFLHLECASSITTALKHRFQKQPCKCSMCGRGFSDNADVVLRLTRGFMDKDYDKGKQDYVVAFKEDDDRPSMCPDYYLCLDCAATEIPHAEVVEELIVLDNLMGGNARIS